jgi:uncharacterized membrane protein YfcA
MRATMAAIFTVSTGFRIAAFLISGLLFESDVWWAAAIIWPFMFIGLNIGHRLHGRLNRKHLSILMSTLLTASGLSLVMRAF